VKGGQRRLLREVSGACGDVGSEALAAHGMVTGAMCTGGLGVVGEAAVRCARRRARSMGAWGPSTATASPGAA
jgi:hypothetical protein